MSRQVVPLLLVLGLAAAPAAAQDAPQAGQRRLAFDTVVGTQDFFGEDQDWQAVQFIDLYTGLRVRPGWQVSFRPVIKRVRGEWDFYVDHLSVRYEARARANWRFEAGRFSSPIGLGMTELRPNQNPSVLWWHRPYYMPLPSLGAGLPRVSLVSAVYPVGASVSASGARWDARAALVDRAPVEFWQGWDGSSRSPNPIVGAGISPRQGFRLGAASAWGEYASATPTRPGQRYMMVNTEGEFAIGYTKVSGEWTRDRFETPAGDRISSGWTAQVQQTITPRIFLHGRATVMRSPEAVASAPGGWVEREYRALDTTMGYRLTPEVTLRAAYTAIKNWSVSSLDHQFGLSVFLARRWW
jgi:hypothetical protein